MQICENNYKFSPNMHFFVFHETQALKGLQVKNIVLNQL